jgi:hypothetical protein
MSRTKNLRTTAIVLPNQGLLKYSRAGNLNESEKVRRDAQSVPHF